MTVDPPSSAEGAAPGDPPGHDRSHHLPAPHPVYVRALERRAADRQLRVADAITRFAGSMVFVYVHVVVFAVWCATGLFGRDRFPFNFLTLVVSLEAIFLSTFVMIGQNRQSEFARAKADHDFVEQEQELKFNTELTRQVHAIVLALQAQQGGVAQGPSSGQAAADEDRTERGTS